MKNPALRPRRHPGSGRALLIGVVLLALGSRVEATGLPAERRAALEEFLPPFVELAMFDGSVLIEQGGEVIYEQSFGLANYEHRVPHRPTTRFRIASVSKLVTDVAVARLIRSGTLRLDTPLGRYLPSFPSADSAFGGASRPSPTLPGGRRDSRQPPSFGEVLRGRSARSAGGRDLPPLWRLGPPTQCFPGRVAETGSLRASEPGCEGLMNNPGWTDGIYSGIMTVMKRVADILAQMRRNPQGVRFKDLCRVCDAYFGEPRQSTGSHRVYKTPWPGNPRVNIQSKKGQGKAYQVRQVLQAIDRLEVEDDPRT